jgi:hypothetical protein
MNQQKLFGVANIIGLTLVVAVNALANIIPINNMNTGEVSSLYPSLFTPAGITFSIWSLIYLLLIGFVIMQWRILHESYFTELSMWFMLSCAANAGWIIAWHYLYTVASVLIMLILLICLVNIFRLLHTVKLKAPENIFIKLPFTIYFSWIGVATIANISALLISLKWSGAPLSESLWTIMMMVIAAGLSAYITVQHRSVAYMLVTIWALSGIFLRWRDTDNTLIATSALILASALGVIAITLMVRSLAHQKTST